MPLNVLNDQFLQSSNSSYKEYTSSDFVDDWLQLNWPDLLSTIDNPCCSWMDIKNLNAAGTIYLPDATRGSIGKNFIINNQSGYALTIKGTSTINPFNLIATLPNNTVYLFVLTNTDTSVGKYTFKVIGDSSTLINASLLAGYGLNAVSIGTSDGSKLNSQILTLNVTTGTEFTITPEHYAQCLLYTGDQNIEFNLPITGLTDGFYCSINNGSQYNITLSPPPGSYIQGMNNMVINPEQTLFLVYLREQITINDLSCQWITLGWGIQSLQTATYQSLPVPIGETTFRLTPNQLLNDIIEFQGGNSNLEAQIPIQPGEWVFVNSLESAKILTVQLVNQGGTPTGAPLTIPNQSSRFFYSTGVSLFPITNLPVVNPATDQARVLTADVNAPNASLCKWGVELEEYLTAGGAFSNLRMGPGTRASKNTTSRNIVLGKNVVHADDLFINTIIIDNEPFPQSDPLSTSCANNIMIGRSVRATCNSSIFIGKNITLSSTSTCTSSTVIGTGVNLTGEISPANYAIIGQQQCMVVNYGGQTVSPLPVVGTSAAPRSAIWIGQTDVGNTLQPSISMPSAQLLTSLYTKDYTQNVFNRAAFYFGKTDTTDNFMVIQSNQGNSRTNRIPLAVNYASATSGTQNSGYGTVPVNAAIAADDTITLTVTGAEILSDTTSKVICTVRYISPTLPIPTSLTVTVFNLVVVDIGVPGSFQLNIRSIGGYAVADTFVIDWFVVNLPPALP